MKSSSIPFEPVQKRNNFALYILGGALGLTLSAVVLPLILPGLVQSLVGADIKAFWYFSRGLAIMGYLTLWLSVVWA